jgi:hypothetical protein
MSLCYSLVQTINTKHCKHILADFLMSHLIDKVPQIWYNTSRSLGIGLNQQGNRHDQRSSIRQVSWLRVLPVRASIVEQDPAVRPSCPRGTLRPHDARNSVRHHAARISRRWPHHSGSRSRDFLNSDTLAPFPETVTKLETLAFWCKGFLILK